MEPVLRAVSIYLALLVIFRLAGKRTLAEATPFDFVLLLIIGEATQQSLLGEDYSLTNAIFVVMTLIGFDVLLSLFKQRSRKLEELIDGVPVVVVEDGRLIRDRMNKSRISEEDILNAARIHHGLERMDQIKYAILECSGGISIVPKPRS